MKIDYLFSYKIALPWQQHLSRYLENRLTYFNKIFIDLHYLSKATYYQRKSKIFAVSILLWTNAEWLESASLKSTVFLSFNLILK